MYQKCKRKRKKMKKDWATKNVVHVLHYKRVKYKCIKRKFKNYIHSYMYFYKATCKLISESNTLHY